MQIISNDFLPKKPDLDKDQKPLKTNKLVKKIQQLTEKVQACIIANPLFLQTPEGKELVKSYTTLLGKLNTNTSVESEFLARLKKINQKLLKLENDKETINQNVSIVQDLEELRKSSFGILDPQKKEKQFYRLQAIPKNSEIIEGFSQITVLNQYEDKTDSGFENCGFHSFKNALLMLTRNKSPDELHRLLNDKDLFLEFYNTYCLPVIKDSKKGSRDASIPILRKVIDLIKNDPSPPVRLAVLQKALKEAIKENNLAIFQISTTNGEDNGEPVFGFIDPAQSLEGKKLYQFSNDPGRSQFTMILGNEIFGHWYAITVCRDESGTLNFFGCDSADNHHDTLGYFSPLGKMSGLIKKTFLESDEFLKAAYDPVDSMLSIRAGWFETDQSIPVELSQILLDETPSPIFASLETPQGSTKEQILFNCLAAYDIMQAGNWLRSKDYWVQLKVSDLEKLVSFYNQNLSPEDRHMSKLKEILQNIRGQKPLNLVEDAFKEALADIEKLKGTISSNEFEQTYTLFKHLLTLYNERKNLSQITDESERLKAMNVKTSLSGVEDGFTAGKTANEAEKSILGRVNTLLLTYQKAKKLNRVNDFIKIVSNGDRCLTARMGRVSLFQAELSGLGNVEEVTSFEHISEAPVLAIATSLGDLDIKKEEIEIATKEILTNPDNLKNLSKCFKQFASGERTLPFRKYLIQKRIIEDTDHVNWKEALQKMIKMPEFDAWFSAGKIDALKWL